MSFIYPRLISIYRPNVNTAVDQGNQELLPSDETLIANNIRASIQLAKTARNLKAGLAGDVLSGSFWKVFFRSPIGLVNNNDIIVDDSNNRYQVTANYWNSLGYNCLCELLQT